MEPLTALNALVANAVERTGERSEPALFRRLRLSEAYLYKWRKMLREGQDGPTFRTVLPLLEAAGAFSSGSSELEDVQRQREVLAAEIDRLESRAVELEAQQTPRKPRRAATGG